MPRHVLGAFALAFFAGMAGLGPSTAARAEIQSRYTPTVAAILHSWPPKTRRNPDSKAPARITIECYSTPGSDFYVGVGQWMTVSAPLATVAGILDDFAHYSDLFPDLAKVNVLSREGGVVKTYWQEHVPLFFIPDVKFVLDYRTESSPPPAERRTYLYQLVEGNRLKYSDGLIVLEPAGSNTTLYTELDFADADWGMLKAIAPKKIWKESVEGIFLSDAAILLKAEHPDWDYARVKRESRALLKPDPIDPCIRAKKEFVQGDFMK